VSDERSDGGLRISVTPDPTDEELAAIVSAVTATLVARADATAPPLPKTSRWARAGRLDAMRGRAGDEPLPK